MELENTIKEMLPHIESELHYSIDEYISSDTPELKTMLDYHMGWEGEGNGIHAQGKRIRPLLVLLSAGAINSKWENALPAAAAVELLHNFSLIHDDIQDNSSFRRGRPTVWKKWGVAQAINAGDLLFTIANLAIFRINQGLSSDKIISASLLLHNSSVNLTHGQYLDISYESRNNIEVDSYWKMIEGKTASLLGCCTEMGALIAGCEPDRQLAFKQFGFTLGLAFQIIDDWLGIWGDSAQTGKSTHSDLVSGKKTLPILFALSQKGKFSRIWENGKINPEDVTEISKILENEGAREYTEITAKKLTIESLQFLEEAAIFQDYKNALIDLSNVLLSRNK